MEFSTSGYFEAVGILSILYTKAYVSVQFSHKTVAQVTGSYVFTFLSGKRTVIYYEIHRNRRLGNFLEWNCFRVFRSA